MKKSFALLIFLFTHLFSSLSAQSEALFDETRIASIYVELPVDSLQFMLDNLVSERYLHARFVFDDGLLRDTVEDIGLRLRGNTSLNAAKKSFKISFNEFVAGREYQQVRKLNLRGQAVDPTLIREKLYYEIWKKANLPERRAAFVKFYINGDYRGLYTNMEELDKQWLDRTFPDKSGNLYKCTWPADLVWLGASQQLYKNILHDADDRAYKLATNETADDYSRFVLLVEAINKPLTANYAAQLEAILNVNGVLKAWAIDIGTGNWDDYFYLKNNYYLYDNPATGRFEWMAYDTDNSFGIDWVNRDWAKRNCLDWQTHSEPRPLATQLLAVPVFKERFVRYLDTVAQLICPDAIFPRIDELHTLVTPAAVADPFRPLDFGYTVQQFHNSYTQSLDNHTPYGLKPFLEIRCDSIRSQIAGLLSGVGEQPGEKQGGLRVFPNPAGETLFVRLENGHFAENVQVSAVSSAGARVGEWFFQTSEGAFTMPTGDLPAGLYFLEISTETGRWQGRFLKI